MVAGLTLLSDILLVVLEHQGFVEFVGTWLILIQGFSSMLIMYLRTYKTTATIGGIFTAPLDTLKTHPPTKGRIDPVEAALAAEDENLI